MELQLTVSCVNVDVNGLYNPLDTASHAQGLIPTNPIKNVLCVACVASEYLLTASHAQGLFPHIPPIYPMGNWDTSFGIPWWRDKQYQVSVFTS